MGRDARKLISDEPEEDSDTSSSLVELVVDKSKEKRKDEMIPESNIYDFDIETIKDKPWLKPGADITDYFNYGFTEATWTKYCEMQRENRKIASSFEKGMEDGTKKPSWGEIDM